MRACPQCGNTRSEIEEGSYGILALVCSGCGGILECPIRSMPSVSRSQSLKQQEDLVGVLAGMLVALGLPTPIREHRFALPRRWSFDLAWPDRMTAVEVDGVVHRIRDRFEADLEKMNTAASLGWRVYRVTNTQVRDHRAAEIVRNLMEIKDFPAGQDE